MALWSRILACLEQKKLGIVAEPGLISEATNGQHTWLDPDETIRAGGEVRFLEVTAKRSVDK